MQKIEFVLKRLDDTEKLGNLLGRLAVPGDVICLDGDLGAGKTALTQAIARGVGVDKSCYVTSPSFAILHEYPGKMVMYHMDFYRLEDSLEVEDLGFLEYIYGQGLTVIEWSARAAELLPENRLILELTLEEDLSRTVRGAAGDPDNKFILAIRENFVTMTTDI
ncbi:tRNA (adenosine(37)-N6)-threonylcarbamoyltransferase complex ATPase subunit type 1 TsaE [Desulforhopalus singaporensis]|uniref:tRNA threonylcarbamoyladenosine biosynthesis protein TsaE n=1 Tax=Desulforhopalus singaporensis TaxID=91360 RepID=A0A1H0PIB8_9BACT|nr:tRNA (adenosine(37)-N6)-threonylcarbamoyltransferase complex ATPase subunit type 1 TsaE [Desulforhopalus singaporensis]SDP04405.1 tRNA threonylcarbamoyladenosine biosynthesis protein TsaE [Desulforhopalus singaporensis]